MKYLQDLLIIVYGFIVWSLAFTCYFNWFLVPVFNLKEINYAQGIALFMFSRLLKSPVRDLYYKGERIEYIPNIWITIFFPWIMLLLGVFVQSYF